MDRRTFFFAGGGTGGHIYPAIAVAEKLREKDSSAAVHFFCSGREIDSQILSGAGYEFTVLPACGFSFGPAGFVRFWRRFFKSCSIARSVIGSSGKAAVLGVGGFVGAPVCRVGYKHKVPVKLLNVDIVAGRANKLAVRWADEVFVQFRETAEYFAGKGVRANVVGCPLRKGFENPQREKVIDKLGLDKDKKTLVVTGASSGSARINEAVVLLLGRMGEFVDSWQVVHLTGKGDYEKVMAEYGEAEIKGVVLSYFDEMAGLLAAADLAVGRSGAVSVAEFAAAGVPTVFLPYPYHRDRHQYLNAEQLVRAGAAVIVDDLADAKERAEWLWEELKELMRDKERREQMRKNAESVAVRDAAEEVAGRLLDIE